MFSLSMENLVNISIITDDKSGLAQIMTGYLSFYSNKKINISIKGKTRVMHPLAEQVLREDGIDLFEAFPTIQKGIPNFLIYINKEPLEDATRITKQRKYYFNEPVKKAGSEDIIDAYRAIREEIKKECIHLIGELHGV